MCDASALDQNEVAGKVVLCDNSSKIDVYYQMEEVERAGAYAGIFLVDISDLQPNDFIIPSLILDNASGTLVRKYVTEDSKAKDGQKKIEADEEHAAQILVLKN
ncbi:hypothetical protein LWI28_028282 [Acer negundo]|uniref:PA domain-containing protein n=1 Tax=Acer negundo TaxID=4023 RepID=A0AAD5P822_ACENE|nr:hypothetical protein LWI28_028282 [Acer negundo]